MYIRQTCEFWNVQEKVKKIKKLNTFYVGIPTYNNIWLHHKIAFEE